MAVNKISRSGPLQSIVNHSIISLPTPINLSS